MLAQCFSWRTDHGGREGDTRSFSLLPFGHTCEVEYRLDSRGTLPWLQSVSVGTLKPLATASAPSS